MRAFRSADAEGVVELRRTLTPEAVLTAEGLIYWRRSSPRTTHTRWWVAAEGDRHLGLAMTGLENWTSEEGIANLWVGVHPDRRGEGIGSRMYELADSHLSQLGPRKIFTNVREGDRTGTRFASKRGFRKSRSSKVWSLDPRRVDLSDLPERRDAADREGFRLVPLDDLRDRPKDFFGAYLAATRDIPSDIPLDISYRQWKKEIWDYPDLDFQASVVLLHEDRPVSFVTLVVDPKGSRAYHELTGTVPEFRRRGLARLAKMAAIRWCLENGINEIFTDNDSTNSDMLAINEHLGYEPRPAWNHLVKGRKE